ncbi:hypothetical protein MRX96_042327 [Rhipicephalus microplus]
MKCCACNAIGGERSANAQAGRLRASAILTGSGKQSQRDTIVANNTRIEAKLSVTRNSRLSILSLACTRAHRSACMQQRQSHRRPKITRLPLIPNALAVLLRSRKRPSLDPRTTIRLPSALQEVRRGVYMWLFTEGLQSPQSGCN